MCFHTKLSLCLNMRFSSEQRGSAKPGVGKSARKQGLHKPESTYFVKRLKCKLTEYFNPHHLLPVLQPGTSEHSWSFLAIMKKEQELRFQLTEELSGGLAEVVWGFNE